jgi:hypothetical protein
MDGGKGFLKMVRAGVVGALFGVAGTSSRPTTLAAQPMQVATPAIQDVVKARRFSLQDDKGEAGVIDAAVVHLAGAETITGVKTFTATTVAPIRDSGGQVVNARIYGLSASASAATNSSAIASAAVALPNGGTLLLDGGVGTCSINPVVINGITNLRVVGTPWTTFKTANNNKAICFGFTNCPYLRVEGLFCDGGSATNTVSSMAYGEAVIYTDTSDYAVIANCDVKGGATSYHCIAVNHAVGGQIIGNSIHDHGDGSCILRYGSNGTIAHNRTFNTLAIADYNKHAYDLHFHTDGIIKDNHANNIKCAFIQFTACTRGVARGNTGTLIGWNAWKVDGGTGPFVFEGNEIDQCGGFMSFYGGSQGPTSGEIRLFNNKFTNFDCSNTTYNFGRSTDITSVGYLHRFANQVDRVIMTGNYHDTVPIGNAILGLGTK